MGVKDVLNEWKILNSIALPGHVIHILDRSFWISTYLFLGHHGKGNLATGLLATSTLNLSLYFMEGFLSSQDVFIFQSKGIDKIEKTWLYVSMMYVFAFTVLAVGMVVAFDLYLYHILTLNTNVTFKIMFYLWLLLPTVCFHGLQRVLQQYFTIKSLYTPVVISLIVGLLCNCIGSSIMFYTNVGPIGCAVSVSVSKMITMSVLAYFVNEHLNDPEFFLDIWLILKILYKKVNALYRALFRMRLPERVQSALKKKQGHNKSSSRFAQQEDIMVSEETTLPDYSEHKSKKKPRKLVVHEEDSADIDNEGLELIKYEDGKVNNEISREDKSLLELENPNVKYSAADTISNFMRYGIVGVPGGLLMIVDMWPYEVLCIIVASFGTIAMDTHQMLFIFQQYMVISLVLPSSTAATVRIQTLLKLKKHHLALSSAWWCIFQGFFVSCGIGFLIWMMRYHFGYMITNNSDIIHRSETISLYAALLCIPYGLQTSLKGVLRAANFHADMIIMQFVAIWIIGFPLGIYLSIFARPTFGLEGIWIGMLVGVGLHCLALLLQVILLDWTKESRKFNYRMIKYAENISKDVVTGVYLNEIALPNIASLAIGGFYVRTQTIQEEIEELEITELSEAANPLIGTEDSDHLVEIDSESNYN